VKHPAALIVVVAMFVLEGYSTNLDGILPRGAVRPVREEMNVRVYVFQRTWAARQGRLEPANKNAAIYSIYFNSSFLGRAKMASCRAREDLLYRRSSSALALCDWTFWMHERPASPHMRKYSRRRFPASQIMEYLRTFASSKWLEDLYSN
jgi:hypothetical protein